MKGFKTTRVCAGFYKVSGGGVTIDVTRQTDWEGDSYWIATDPDDRFFYSDPLPTKRVAVECAQHMVGQKLEGV